MPYISHFKAFAEPCFLAGTFQGETAAAVELKHIQAPAGGDVPAGVGADEAVVDGFVELPGKADIQAEKFIREFLEMGFDFTEFDFSRPCNQVECDVFSFFLDGDDYLDELDEVLNLISFPDVGILEFDAFCSGQVGAEESLITHSGLIFLDGDVIGTGESCGSSRGCGRGGDGLIGYGTAGGGAGFFVEVFEVMGVADFFGGAHIGDFAGFQVFVAEMDRVESGVEFVDFRLHPFAAFDGEVEDSADFFFAHLPVGVEDFHEAGEGFVDTVLVSGGEGAVEFKVGAVEVSIILESHEFENLGEVVDDEAELTGEHFVADDVHFPAGEVEVDAVQEGGVLIAGGEVVKEVGLFEQVGDAFAGVADEHHGGIGGYLVGSPGEGVVGHVVLHYVHQGFIGFLTFSGELVEGDNIPVAHQAEAAVAVVHEEFGQADFTAGDEDAVGGELAENVGLAGAFGTQLDEVVVVFAVGDDAGQLEEFVSLPQLFGIEPQALYEEVDPLLQGEFPPEFLVGIQFHMRNLYGLEGVDYPGNMVLVVFVEVFNVQNAPDTADKKFGMLPDVLPVDDDFLDAQVAEGGFVGVALVVELNGDFIDNFVAAGFPDF